MDWLAVGLGGGLGSMLRYALSGWVVRKFPAGTFVANIAGCLLIGVLLGCAARTGWPGPRMKAFLVTGLLGGLTTFSTFSWQTWELAIIEKSLAAAAFNLLMNLIPGLLAVWAGVTMSRWT